MSTGKQAHKIHGKGCPVSATGPAASAFLQAALAGLVQVGQSQGVPWSVTPLPIDARCMGWPPYQRKPLLLTLITPGNP